MVADDEMLHYWTCVMGAAGAMLFGRRTYELMEDAWPQVAREPNATPSNRDWAKKLEAKPKYVVSTTPATSRGATRMIPDPGGEGVEEGHAARTAGG
jgi:dihydrofolate reductase